MLAYRVRTTIGCKWGVRLHAGSPLVPANLRVSSGPAPFEPITCIISYYRDQPWSAQQTPQTTVTHLASTGLSCEMHYFLLLWTPHQTKPNQRLPESTFDSIHTLALATMGVWFSCPLHIAWFCRIDRSDGGVFSLNITLFAGPVKWERWYALLNGRAGKTLM